MSSERKFPGSQLRQQGWEKYENASIEPKDVHIELASTYMRRPETAKIISPKATAMTESFLKQSPSLNLTSPRPKSGIAGPPIKKQTVTACHTMRRSELAFTEPTRTKDTTTKKAPNWKVSSGFKPLKKNINDSWVQRPKSTCSKQLKKSKAMIPETEPVSKEVSSPPSNNTMQQLAGLKQPKKHNFVTDIHVPNLEHSRTDEVDCVRIIESLTGVEEVQKNRTNREKALGLYSYTTPVKTP